MTVMNESSLAYLPTVKQLLETEVFSEAQVMVGDLALAKVVSQVVSGFSSAHRAGALVVVSAESISPTDSVHLPNLSGVVLVRSGASEVSAVAKTPIPSAAGSAVKAAVVRPVRADVAIENLVKLCAQSDIAVIAISSFIEATQIVEEIRAAYLKEVKVNAIGLHAYLLRLVLTEGLDGLVENLSLETGRPIAVETANFQLLASRNMGATPISQQSNVTEQIGQALTRGKKFFGRSSLNSVLPPIKIARRLVAPIIVDDVVVGYISAMTRLNDNLEMLAEYLTPAASAATADFYQRRKDGSILTVTQKSLLKDLLSGRGLSAADQERVERHYSFDLCDGLLVFAVATISGELPTAGIWTDETVATTEVEGTRIFVLPYSRKQGKTWQQIAENLRTRLKQSHARKENKSEWKLLMGVGRLADNILSLAEAYREARQALIIGSMVQGNEEFIIGYGALGVKRLLYLMIDHPELLRFCEENLAPLESYDAESQSELVPSLRVYLDQGANLNSTARTLFIHRHTLRYRLEQIADILKVDIDSQETLLNLQIAFLIKDMKQGKKGKDEA